MKAGPAHVEVIQQVASALELVVEQVAVGGEFGAAFVRDRSGRWLVLKATTTDLGDWKKGVSLAQVLRADGYPAPEHLGTGFVGEAAWSLQTRLPGRLPEAMTEDHARQLIELAHRHVARAPHPDPAWAFEEYRRCLLGTAWLTERPRTKSLGRELTEVLERLGPSSARSQDIVHNDFHYRNYLCEEDRVTGVFDWEGAVAGDWRYDLATLAFWSGLASEYTDEARRLCLQALAAACDPALVAFLGIAMTTRVIGFYEEVRPESVSPKLELVEANIASWWR